jgi:hypothetical protein
VAPAKKEKRMEERGDPFREGIPAWQEQAQDLACHWADGAGLVIEWIEVAKTMEYVIVDAVNNHYRAAMEKHE